MSNSGTFLGLKKSWDGWLFVDSTCGFCQWYRSMLGEHWLYALEQALVEPIITSRNVISPNPGRHHAFHGGTGPIVQIYNNRPPQSMTIKGC